MFSNIWLSKWSSANFTAEETATRDMYLGIYGGLGIGQGESRQKHIHLISQFITLNNLSLALFTFFASISLSLGTLFAAKRMHEGMIARTMRCPMSYFDTTPIGRIVNRFAKDVDVVDNTLPQTIRTALICFLAVCLVTF